MHSRPPMSAMTDISPYLRTDYKAVDKRDGLNSVMGWVSGDSGKFPIVTDEGKTFGILNERALMGRRLDKNAHVETYSMTTRAVAHDATLEDVARRMAELRAAHLPVEDARGKLAGYVSAIDIARGSTPDASARELCVRVTTLKEAQSLGEALHAFGKEYVDFLPVMNGDGRAAGVIRRRTLLRLETNIDGRGRKDNNGEKIHPLKDAIGGFMEPATRLPASASKAAVLDALEDAGHALIEAPDGRLVGIVTPETLLRAARG